MKMEDVLTLAKSGFTAQQIGALMTLSNPQTVQPVAPVQPVLPTADPIMAEIQRLTSTLQANALLGTNLPQPQNMDDILAQIINPTQEVTK